MDKIEIKRILMSIRTADNERIVNNLLGKIDLLDDEKLETMVNQIGDTENDIRNFLQNKITEKQSHVSEEHTPINEMFTYGITGNCIHLHMPVDLHQMMKEIGPSKTLDMVNLHLLDAIEKIRKLQNDGYYKFEGKDSIYMISPALVGKEIKELEQLNFDTKTYKKNELKDENFVKENKEAQLAIKIFGKDLKVGTARIGMDVINTEEWQGKRKIKQKELQDKGAKLEEEKDIKME